MQSKGQVRFRDFIEQAALTNEVLPLVHTTSAYSFMDICDEDELRPTQCKHFEEDLIYLFYGRPSYRTQKSINSTIGFNYPFVFIFDPEKIANIVAVYPFDTGAFFYELYSKFFDKNANVYDFELPPTLQSANQTVNSFYLNHSEYMHGPSKKNVDISRKDFEARGVQELSRLPPYLSNEEEDIARDERSSSIEVQVDSPIDIRSAILGIVVPAPFLNEAEVVEALDRWNVGMVRSYEIFEFHSPGTWIAQIYQEICDAYIELGFLK